ncbi:MAG: hypothetical protein OEL89_01020 [Candidatus Peregrinibacteria bacterium]|nr:hypothetical protein [Candidatus Peregrinibacteria bacterium]
MDKEDAIELLSNKKFQWIATVILLLTILIIGANIRLQPVTTGNLIDKTTGDYTPLALDPYYFLRVSETMIANNGILPVVDGMRYQAARPGWTTEILPHSIVLLWNVIKIIDSTATLNFADVLNPVVFFTLGLIIFFFLILLLTKNRPVSLASTAILTVIPPYLYRTLAGFSDHEAIGMFGIFLSLFTFLYGMFYLNKENPKNHIASAIGIVSGICTTFSIAGWGGGAKFLFMILPLAFIVTWFVKKGRHSVPSVLFYSSWIVSVLLIAPVIGFKTSFVLSAFMLTPAGILSFITLGYILVNFIIEYFKIIGGKFSKYSEIISAGIMFILGAILYGFFVGDVFSLIINLLEKIINPFGVGRVGLTVAENKQPYLSDWVGQISKTLFYTMLAGCFLVGIKISEGINTKKLRPLFVTTFAAFISGILFSRISAGSILNGENFISKALFSLTFLAFAISTAYIYIKSEWKVDTKWIFIAAWMIPMLLAVRSAIRVFFAIVPFVSFMVPLTLFELSEIAGRYKDNIMKIVSWSIFVILIIGVTITSYGFYKSVDYQAKMQSPSYNADWQNAMSWVRENTTEGSIFLHWWDYGYWVQTGGDRPTVTDGGHNVGYWDHLVGRYVLTTPYPETAKSFMKTHNVSYLLIDPSDIGKYSAYSSIGDDKDVSDRSSYITTFISQQSEIQETRNGSLRMYRGGFVLDDDIIYKNNSQQIFLPRGKAGLGAIIIERIDDRIRQPIGVFVYNNKQYRLPLRYIYINGGLHDFGTGINSVAYIYPNIYMSGAAQQMDQEGAIMYLSEKVKDSLVAQLYLMNDPNKEYGELELVHSESAYPFIFSYGGRAIGPIKIWKVNLDQMDGIIARDEFTKTSGEYGEMDDLQFVK